jgi:hypothetical protein
LDVVPYDCQVRPEDIRYGGNAVWTDLSMCAVKMLHTAAQGGTPSDTDTTWLGRQLARTPWAPLASVGNIITKHSLTSTLATTATTSSAT